MDVGFKKDHAQDSIRLAVGLNWIQAFRPGI
jgi:hypothetical protein